VLINIEKRTAFEPCDHENGLQAHHASTMSAKFSLSSLDTISIKIMTGVESHSTMPVHAFDGPGPKSDTKI
jgi:hypothetical protein